MLSGGRALAQTTQRGRKGFAVNVVATTTHREREQMDDCKIVRSLDRYGIATRTLTPDFTSERTQHPVGHGGP